MVRAWYMDSEDSDQRLPHHRSPPHFVPLDELYRLTGVEHFKIDASLHQTDAALAELKERRGYTYEDEIVCSRDCLPDYDTKLRSFYAEHLHTDEEIRLVLDGSGYFDVRDAKDEWIRIEVVAGDLVVIPSGIYHRFTLDENNFIRAKRYFVGEPVWLPYNRPADDMDVRRQYVTKLNGGFVASVH